MSNTKNVAIIEQEAGHGAKRRDLHICHVITGLDVGGAETLFCQLLEKTSALGLEHTVVSLRQEGGGSARVSRVAQLHHLRMRPGSLHLRHMRDLRRILRASRPDVVHGWMYHGNIMASLATLGTGIPVVWGVHATLDGFKTEKRSTSFVILAGKYFSRGTRRIIYCSRTGQFDHERFGYAASRSVMIPNGFDTNRFAPDPTARARIRREVNIPEHAVAIGLVARVHPVKDHQNFLQAAARFLNFNKDVVFVLVGNGASRDNAELTRLVASLGLQNHVRLCGHRSDMAEIDNALDIASSSSRSEAFPMVLGEAMACGTPCVATDVGDVREMIGDTGIVVPPRDPAALSDGWVKLVALGVVRRRVLGERARTRIVERYSLASIAAQYAELYASVAKGESKCAG